MKPPEHQLLASPNDYEVPVGSGVMVARVTEDALVGPAEQFLQTKMAELEASNHQLRVENLALRNRIERFKSNRSLEKTVIVAVAISVCFLFLLSVFSKVLGSLN